MGKFSKRRNPNINLEMLGIKPGDKLQFVPASGVFTDIYVTVVDNNNVEYQGEIMSRDKFNKTYNLYQRRGTKTKEQQSTAYLYYKGNKLSNMWKEYCEKAIILEPKKISKSEVKEKSGYVYILTNPYFKENIYKCGNSKDFKKRVKELYTTGVPAPFDTIAVIYVKDCEAVESYFHQMMDIEEHRVTPNREFFYGNPEDAKKHLHLIVDALFPDSGKIVI